MLLLLSQLALAGPLLAEEANPIEADCNAGALNGTLTCDFYVARWTNATLNFDYTYDAATGWTCALWQQDKSASDWYAVMTQSVSSGAITISPAVITRVVAADDSVSYNLPINYQTLRLVCDGTGSPTASDTLTVNAYLTRPD